ncbi:MAG: tRNA guanosine(34) transglycosylase Tgt [Candidatus Gracilibacteria bacterium]|nr:tRNA guanosine(34) transglycosylase Tgt [Candidatus Gracilibacteria bacterium]
MFEFRLENTDGYARAGEFNTTHGKIKTPIFMPVGTKSTVKGIHPEELDEMGAEIILNNTYHLYLRPGDKIVKDFGGAHKFMNYNKPILTDSGGFQVFSLGQQKYTKFTGSNINSELNTLKNEENKNSSLVKITEQGVHFRSYIDGSKHYFDAENVMDIQSNIGADIIMAFDECAPGKSTKEYAKSAMDRTHRWAERCVIRWKENNLKREQEGNYPQALFPIIQGVTFDDLRKESAEFIGKLDTPGIAIGGLSVGEPKVDMYRILDVLKDNLPINKPRYLMGVGTPEDLVEGIYRGIDMFDCVLPTRLGRHGVAFSSTGNIRIKNKQWELSKEPLDENCDCKVCKNYTKGYLRHLTQEGEMLGMQLMSYHNLYFLINLGKNARKAILENKYEEFRNNFWSKYPKDVLNK